MDEGPIQKEEEKDDKQTKEEYEERIKREKMR